MPSRDPINVLAISGSLRKASLNTALLRAAKRLAPDRVSVEIFDIGNIPLFNQDVEDDGVPESVVELKQALGDADGLLLASAEYNGGLTAALKNTIDWASRPPGDSPLPGKPTAILGATPGPSGTRFSQMVLRHVLGVLRVPVLPSPAFYLAHAANVFEDGEVTDPKTEERLQKLLQAFEKWIERNG